MSASVLSVALELLLEEFFSIVRYPVWWYGAGFQRLLNWVSDGLRYRWRRYAIGLWARHLLTPMYGEYSFLGRAVSFFMRVVVIVGRSAAWTVEAGVYALLIVLWVIWPVVAVFGLLYTMLNQQLLHLV